jgi:hypothetical protein
MDNQVDNLAKAIIAAALIQSNPGALNPVQLGTSTTKTDFFHHLPAAVQKIYDALKNSQA